MELLPFLKVVHPQLAQQLADERQAFVESTEYSRSLLRALVEAVDAWHADGTGTTPNVDQAMGASCEFLGIPWKRRLS